MTQEASVLEGEGESSRQTLSDRDFKRALTDVAPHLRAFARGLCGSPDRADDLAQEALLRAWAARNRFTAGTNFRAWTFTILRNFFYSEARRSQFKGEYDDAVAERILKAPAAQEDALELADALRALQSIPDTHREALMLVVGAGLSYEEVAEICEIAVGTVKSRVSRARAMLEEIIAEGHLPIPRSKFVLDGTAIEAFFAELAKIANCNGGIVAAA
ncbi:MAG: sigma-70 family RNA polymerase sigma factor [Novosphingobium sp.]|nr:sigma-70 family RNA polymerase sigma factor [Novosphingobium sp.]